MRSAFDPFDLRALVAIFKAQQDGRDVGCVQRFGKIVRDRVRIAKRRRDEIEARRLASRPWLVPMLAAWDPIRRNGGDDRSSPWRMRQKG